ncbi:septal ring lytic transglycosylase RlpA family protein [Leptospira sp. GIMC2001]|uniref:septal ring lytic transglycosylase RlpA family protein n=1 Tax=Leptospira sp. GIMC2001 TaxID=1513297 RepID=UPI00234B836F|nr:septal ring lytic transglycosylase RlpA family protein [Leptospira sp. GIMC2001]WCL48983.1 septal ring lytic transglycosylase RlpA family protein [Leptospira sp. GIMC2001]
MKKILWILPAILFWTVACTSTDSTRRKVSASGDPEDIFFEKSMNSNDAVAKSVQDDLQPSSIAKFDLPEKKPDTTGNFDEVGYSSWYGNKYQGRPTASGEPFDSTKLTAAHRTLPMGSIVKVQNLENQKEAMVRVNDRGPFVDGRILDVSEKAAEILNFKEQGITKVGLTVVKKGDSNEKFEELDDSDIDDEAELVDDTNRTEKLTPKKESGIASSNANKPKGYTVQVGVFRDQNRASKYKDMMKNNYGQDVFVFSREDGYVVQMGDFASKEKAEALKSKLRYNGVECFIPRK